MNIYKIYMWHDECLTVIRFWNSMHWLKQGPNLFAFAKQRHLVMYQIQYMKSQQKLSECIYIFVFLTPLINSWPELSSFTVKCKYRIFASKNTPIQACTISNYLFKLKYKITCNNTGFDAVDNTTVNIDASISIIMYQSQEIFVQNQWYTF